MHVPGWRAKTPAGKQQSNPKATAGAADRASEGSSASYPLPAARTVETPPMMRTKRLEAVPKSRLYSLDARSNRFRKEQRAATEQSEDRPRSQARSWHSDEQTIQTKWSPSAAAWRPGQTKLYRE